jgi:hypothetical protein
LLALRGIEIRSDLVPEFPPLQSHVASV